MGMESTVQGVLPAQPVSAVSPPSSGAWASASSWLCPSSSSSSPPSWWVATCRRWCARAGSAESCTRWGYRALGPRGAWRETWVELEVQKEVWSQRGPEGERDRKNEGDG